VRPPTTLAACTATTGYTTQIDWFGTVRGRIGYVWGNGEVMSYITGGLAYGECQEKWNEHSQRRSNYCGLRLRFFVLSNSDHRSISH